jgi:hypothetical protein
VRTTKLRTTLDEFGEDKTDDVIDAAESGAAFKRLYAEALLNPQNMGRGVEQLMEGAAKRC